jgi:hypothetical protein
LDRLNVIVEEVVDAIGGRGVRPSARTASCSRPTTPFDLGPNFLPTLESGVFNEVELEKIYHGNAERMFTFGP